MAQHKSNYQLLIEKLDLFIRKFYVNHLIRGLLYSSSVLLVLFLSFNFLEHEFYFNTTGRKVLFFSFLGISAIVLSYWILLPLLHYYRLGKTISHEKAAQIIGNHFADVKDRLINILQLRRQSADYASMQLIEASINQKSESIKLVPFRAAIDLSNNKKYLKYALPPFLFLLFLLLAAPSLIKDSTHRIINNHIEFEKAAPFHFNIDEENLEAIQYSDFKLTVDIEGDVHPNDAFIDIENYQYRLKKESPSQFVYHFKNLQQSMDFSLFSGKVKSKNYTLHVLPKPNIIDFEVKLTYPSYTKRRSQTMENIGDLLVPAGTRRKWNINTVYTDQIGIKFNRSYKEIIADRDGASLFSFKKYMLQDDRYKIYISNKHIPKADSISYQINVIPDQYPSISVQQYSDSTEQNLIYFAGKASDDYGLKTITFNYQLIKEDGSEKANAAEIIKQPNTIDASYDYTLDVNQMKLEPGDQLSFYFETFDNDAVNGSKSSRTGVMTLSKPSVEEFEKMEDENEEDIKDKLEESIEEAKKLQEELKDLREKLLQEKEMDWQNKKDLEELIKRQKELEKMINEAKEKFDENLKNQEEFSEQQEDIKEKQENLQEMFEEVMDEEMQKLMEQIQELMQELQKENALEMMEQMEMNDESMEKEMDRLLELFKQLEVEKELEELIEQLNELAEKQEELSDKTENEKEGQEELKKEQEDINEQFDDMQEKMEELEKKNEELKFPKDLGEDNEEQMEDIEEDLQESQESLENNENQKASKSQKGAAKKMKSMAGNLQSSMESGEMEQMEEDMKALRQLLENLVTLSFDQEDLIGQISRTNVSTPRYIDLVQQQFKIQDDFQLVEDSLHALSMRIEQIESFVIEKVTEVKYNLKESISQLEERQKPTAGQNQRYTMKNLNDLALMLSESMNNLQQQMAGMMSGNQMCNKPGGTGSGKSGDKPSDKISDKQGELNGQMKKMKQGMQNGKQGSAKDFAQAAAKQAALRKAMEEMMQKSQEQGKPAQGLQEIIDQMDQIETDLVNKRLDNQMLQRQQEILTRLLEAEEAERQREYDNKRKAEVGPDIAKTLPPSLEEYIKKREAEVEMFKSKSPVLKPYYKTLVDEYYKSLKEN